jgi:hypothetical protein
MHLSPRFVRFRDAPSYLGMDRNRFNVEVRPHLVEIPIGEQGVAFDRLDLDHWADEYKRRNGRPGSNVEPMEEHLWAKKSHQVSEKEAKSGTSKKRSREYDFSRALASLNSGKQKNS